MYWLKLVVSVLSIGQTRKVSKLSRVLVWADEKEALVFINFRKEST